MKNYIFYIVLVAWLGLTVSSYTALGFHDLGYWVIIVPAVLLVYFVTPKRK